MRVGFPGGPRLEWYDRNPSEASIQYSVFGEGPHGVTVRASYTVPAGKKAFISRCYAELIRDTAASSLFTACLYIGTAGVYVLFLSHRNNTVGAREWATIGGSGLLQAGAQVTIQTVDGSTGGTIDYHGFIGLTEFSA